MTYSCGFFSANQNLKGLSFSGILAAGLGDDSDFHHSFDLKLYTTKAIW